MRQYIIRQIFLPQRSRRRHINSIHSLFTMEFRGFCSHNKLAGFITVLCFFVYLHCAWFVLAIMTRDGVSPVNLNEFYDLTVPGLLVFGVYPLLFSIFSLVIILTDTLCTKQYDSICSWHKNSMMQLGTNIVFSTCVTVWFARITFLCEEEFSR